MSPKIHAGNFNFQLLAISGDNGLGVGFNYKFSTEPTHNQ